MTSGTTSWKKTITSPFRKARTFFSHQHHQTTTTDHNNKKSHHHHHHHHDGQDEDKRIMDLQLQGEVMACAYEDVQVMWSILDKSKPRICNIDS